MMRTAYIIFLVLSQIAYLEGSTGDIKILSDDFIQKYKLLFQKQGDRKDLVETTKLVNAYVNEINKYINAFIVASGRDPYVLDTNHGFNFSTIIGTFTGLLSVKNGWLGSLSTLTQIGDAIVIQKGDRLSVQLKLGFAKLVFNAPYIAKILQFLPAGLLEGGVKDLALFVAVSVDANTGRNITLDELALENAQQVKIKMSVSVWVDWLLQILSTVAMMYFSPFLVGLALKVIRLLILAVIGQLNSSGNDNSFLKKNLTV